MKSSKPPFRKLRGYAFDPSLSQKAETVNINSIVYKIPWEELKGNTGINNDSSDGPGPIGEYVEVIDYDPTINKFYIPVDLNENYILAQDGLTPSESNPQFHQQMVYAVAMTTIKNFEQALGRKIIWSSRKLADKQKYQEYVKRLRIYPHALREANAYYSPQKKALLFGYFSSTPSDVSLQMPGSLVFTCLSHDIIAHETTHAILDGMHPKYNNPSNTDVLAFHEAFADIVALFQHFTFPEVLKKQIAETRGDLGSQNLLGKLAQEFGTAIGHYGSLRDAIGEVVDGKWTPKKPNPEDYNTIVEPHERGSILVAAVFEAFINIYKSQVSDLLRIASNGTGILPQGEIHPDLVNRLAQEASKASGHVLKMCIRALDYCPPVDITFGDYLRAIITADLDIVADDNKNYRLYFIDAFRRRGIFPQGIKTLSVESLRFTMDPFLSHQTQMLFGVITNFLRDYRTEIMYENDRQEIYNISRKYMGGNDSLGLHKRMSIKFEDSIEFEELTGIVFSQKWRQLGIRTSSAYAGKMKGPKFEIQNLRLVSRVGPDNNQTNQIIFSIIQRSGVIADENGFKGHYIPEDDITPENGFELWGGCTLIFDLDTLKLKYSITKPLLDVSLLKKGIHEIDKKRIENQSNYESQMEMYISEHDHYFGSALKELNEPFAFLHQH